MHRKQPTSIHCRHCEREFVTVFHLTSIRCPHCCRYVLQSFPWVTARSVKCKCRRCGRRWTTRAATGEIVLCPGGCRHWVTVQEAGQSDRELWEVYSGYDEPVHMWPYVSDPWGKGKSPNVGA